MRPTRAVSITTRGEPHQQREHTPEKTNEWTEGAVTKYTAEDDRDYSEGVE